MFESPNLKTKVKLKLYPIKVHIPELGPQAVPEQISPLTNGRQACYFSLKTTFACQYQIFYGVKQSTK